VRSAGEGLASHLVCSRSGRQAALDEPAFLSPAGAPWLVAYRLDAVSGEELASAWRRRPWSLWRYRELLPVRDWDSRLDLGEGGTPLVPLGRPAPRGVRVLVKDEARNPTGSFKARGMALAVTRARELGAPGVQLPSAGNAALALAAYAAAAGLPSRVAVPEDTPSPILDRCRAWGAEVVTSPGTLVDAALRLRDRADGYWDLSTLREPYRVEGKKTMGLELAEQLAWQLPDWIVYPTGGGTGIVGMWRAFGQLAQLGLVRDTSRFVIVQTTGCAPLVRAFERGEERAEPWEHPETDVWGLRVPQAIGDTLVLRAVRDSGGCAVAVTAEEIAAAARDAARLAGHRFGPEGAATLAALRRLHAAGTIGRGESVVLFQTGDPANYGL
jgi:threonine synthase